MAIYTKRWPTFYALNTVTELELTHTTNVAGNYSTVNYVVRVKKINNWNDHWTPSGSGSYLTLKIGGYNTRSNYRSTWTTLTNTANATAVVASGSQQVPHNSDGTKTISFSLSLNPNVSSISNMPNIEISGSFVATPIPRRASVASLSKSSFNFGETVTLTTNRASTAYTHNVYYVIGSTEYLITSGVGWSAGISVPITRVNSYPSSVSASMNIRVKTYNGSSLIGTQNIPVTVSVPSYVIPTVGSVSVSDTVTKVQNLFTTSSQYVRGVSKLKAVAGTALGSRGSYIRSYQFRVSGVSGSDVFSTTSSYTFPPFNFPNKSQGSSTYTIQARVLDSRGRYSSWVSSGAIRIHYYEPPSLDTPIITRATAGSETLQATRTYSVQSIKQGGTTEVNQGVLKFQYRETGSTSWTDAPQGGYTGLSLSFSTANIGTGFSADKYYEVRAILSDNLNEIISSVQIVGGKHIDMEILKGQSVGIGMSPTGSADLEVGINGINSHGPILVNGEPLTSVSDDMWQVVTQAQYNALSSAQKNDPSKIYLIKL